MPSRKENAKIAFVDIDFRKAPLKFGVKMMVNDPKAWVKHSRIGLLYGNLILDQKRPKSGC